MADSALLIVDAAEGVMPQTRFVLKKAVEANLKMIVVINKIDRKDADIRRVMIEIDNLFLSLANDESFLDFPVVYAVGKDGKTFFENNVDLTEKGDVAALLDTILKYSPSSIKNESNQFKMLVSSFERNEYLGRLALGRVSSGKIYKNQKVKILDINKGMLASFVI